MANTEKSSADSPNVEVSGVLVAEDKAPEVTREFILEQATGRGSGRILAVTGHRPQKLGGYDESHPKRVAIREALGRELDARRPDVTLSGMALGVDTDFALECVKRSLPFVACIPFRGQDSVWRDESRALYRDLVKKAAIVVYVCPSPYAAAKLQLRNEWMVDRCDDLLAVYDGSAGGTRNCVDYAKKLGRPIHVLTPEACVLRPQSGGPPAGAATAGPATRLKVFTSRVGYKGSDGLDTTIKSSQGLGRAFAPTDWDMVMAVKNGGLSQSEYARWYTRVLDDSRKVNPEAWQSLLGRESATLLCYCKPGFAHCHRLILADYLVRNFGAEYGGEIKA